MKTYTWNSFGSDREKEKQKKKTAVPWVLSACHTRDSENARKHAKIMGEKKKYEEKGK